MQDPVTEELMRRAGSYAERVCIIAVQWHCLPVGVLAAFGEELLALRDAYIHVRIGQLQKSGSGHAVGEAQGVCLAPVDRDEGLNLSPHGGRRRVSLVDRDTFPGQALQQVYLCSAGRLVAVVDVVRFLPCCVERLLLHARVMVWTLLTATLKAV